MGRQRQITGGLSTIDGIDGRKPAMGAKPGRCFSGPGAGRDGLGTTIAATGATNRLAEVINRTESYYHNEENCTGNTDSHGSRHTIQ